MKKILLSAYVVLTIIFSATAQVKVEKVEGSRIPKKYLSGQAALIPDFPNKAQALNELYKGIQKATAIEESINIGKNLVFNVDFDTIPEIILDGKIYKEIEIYSPNSNALSVTFSEIELSEEAELMIINDEESYILGPITKENITKKENFDPGFIPGDRIRILYSENANTFMKSKIKISRIGHVIFDYFGVSKFLNSRTEGINCTGFGCSASCHLNINCNSNLTVESRAVALITYSDPLEPGSDISHRGTGYLVNNGSQNKRALFLSMIHGIGGYQVPDLKFIFHYQSPQCSPTTNGTQAYFINGATGLALDAGNDLRLMELSANPGTSPVFSSMSVSYLGWSIINEIVSSVNVIHHPLGDVKKYFIGGAATPIIEPGYSYGVWKYTPTNGFPELVSSGSPTLNSSKRVIGSLRSGSINPNCSTYTSADIYSVRLSRSWSMLCQYLDPNNEGIVAINTYSGSTASKVFPSVSGPTQVCSSSTFTLNNAPLDLSVSWSIIQGASLLSSPSTGTGKSAVVSALNSSVSGEAKIRFTISGLCTNKTYVKTFYVGKPTITGIGFTNPVDENEYFCSSDYGNTFTIYSNSPNTTWQARLLNWPSLTVAYTSPSTYQSNQTYIWSYVPIPNNGYYVFEVRGTNSCGTSAWLPGYEIEYVDCTLASESNFVIYPNPASDIITISLRDLIGKESDKNDLFEVSLFDQGGKRIIGNAKGTESVTFDVSDLNNGFYYIHIQFKDELIRRQVRVEK
ncbi:T9SS type A sorting domain-containing protein [Algoriphagus halophytocola]|uniref:T9SS type A sorting domain-containing protein n=1 Tax=Algoriphagus halophytocola TaxID=2991499 RepID=UPI0022DD6CC0|nr:T9SS type A sorting domain-containing protein [Algoriphagus sp. TR-M9]WBL43013.1 T9SS type A sorting domain-containing protein [Algoriphagus sp. TR-M9]